MRETKERCIVLYETENIKVAYTRRIFNQKTVGNLVSQVLVQLIRLHKTLSIPDPYAHW